MNILSSSPFSHGNHSIDWPPKINQGRGRLRSLSQQAAHRPQQIGSAKRLGAAQLVQLTGQESKRSTEISFTTRDGDTVTISLDAIQRSSEKSQLDIVGQAPTDASQARESLEVEQSASKSESFSLEALFSDDALRAGSIRKSSEQEQQSRVQYSREGENGITRFSMDRMSSSSMEFSLEVEGELDESEIKAISSLIEDLDSVASSFFSGEIENAMDLGQSLGYDESEIAQFSFQVQMSDRSVAMEQYRQYQSLDQDQAAPLPGSVTKPVGDYLYDLANIELNAEKLQRAETMDLIVTELMKLNDDLRDKQFPANELLIQKDRFNTFNKHMLGLVFGPRS